MPEEAALLTVLRRLAGDACSLIASRLLKQVVGFIVEIMLVRLLAPEVWESVARFLTFSLAAQVVLQFGFPESLLNLGSRAPNHAHAKRMLFRSSLMLVCVALVFALVLIPLPALRLRVLGSDALGVLASFALLLAAELVSGIVPSFLLSRRFVRHAAAYAVLARIPTIALALAAVALGASLPVVTGGMALGSCVAAVAGLILAQRLVPQGSEQLPYGLREQLAFAAPVGLTRLAQMLNNQLDKLVVLAALPSVAFGTYYLGAVEVQLVPMLCQTVMSVMVPELVAEKNPQRFLLLFHTSVKKLSLFALPSFAFLFAFAEHGFIAIYGPEHSSAALPFRIFQLLLLHRFTNYALLFQALDKPAVPLIASVIMLSLNAPLSFVLSRSFGANGAATATVTALYLSTLYTFFVLQKTLNVPWSQLLPYRAYGLTLAVAGLSLGPAWLVQCVMPPHAVALSVMLIVYLVTYFLLGRASGVISSADAAFVSDMARLRFLQAKHSA